MDVLNSSIGSATATNPHAPNESQDVSGTPNASPPRRFSLKNMLASFRTPEHAKKKRESSSLDDDNVSTAGSKIVELGSEMSKKLHVTGEDPLRFLSNGFQELLSCRQILKGSFPYAFYSFDDHNDPDTDDIEALYSFIERSGLMDRHIQQSRRQTFERLQSELETYVEILSDICARKRLRASRAQIEQATKNAKSKRIEFEEYISQTNTILEENRRENANGSGKKSPGRSRLFDGSRSSIREMLRLSPTNGRSGRLRMRGIEALLGIDEPLLTSNTNGRRQTRSSEIRMQRRRQERLDRNRDLGAIPGHVTALQHASSTNNTPSSEHDRRELMLEAERRGLSSLSLIQRTSSSPTSRRSTHSGASRSIERMNSSDSDDSIHSLGEGVENRLTNSAENDDGLTASEHLQLQFQEEENLNRAILMSLQASDTLTESVEGNAGGSSEEVAFEPDEGSVEMITSMGFTRDQAVDALRRKVGNVDRAIDFLIN